MGNEIDEEPIPIQRLEWWGGDKDATWEGLLRPLLGQTVVSLHHAALVGRFASEREDRVLDCQASVVFTLEDGHRWELLDAQNSDMRALIFKEIHDDHDLVTAMDLSREPEEHPAMVPITGLSSLDTLYHFYDEHQPRHPVPNSTPALQYWQKATIVDR